MTRGLLWTASAGLVFLLVTSLFGFLAAIRPPRIHSALTPSDLGLPYEEVWIHTADGIRLKGWFIPKPGSQKAIVALHGYPADKGDILPAVRFLHEAFNLLLFDFRYFGESTGLYSTAGAKEVLDLLAAVEFLRDRGFDRIGVWGFSMGGAVALMAAPRSEAIRAIVSESAYAELSLMARENYRHLSILKYPLAFFTELWARWFLGVDLRAASPASQIRQARIPVLILHSTTDRVIPFQHALLLKQALSENPQAEFIFDGGLDHGELGTRYTEKIRTFFLRYL